MAGSQKEFELLFQLKASLGSEFNNTFKNAIDTNNKLQDSLRSVNSLQSKIDGYTKQASAIDKNKEKLQALSQEHDKLQRELSETQEPSEALRKKLEKNESQIQQTTAKIEEQTKKLSEYKEELKAAGVNTDKMEEANRKLQRSYERLQSTQVTLQKIKEKQEAVKNSISATKTQIIGTVGVVTAAAASFFALDSATEEYRNNQAKLHTAYKAAGMNANAAKEAYAGFYRILGDNDTATEASQLLAKLTRNEQDVSKWTDIAAGVLGTFGDSLPIEGLIESANETVRTGQITGVLADAINWASKEGETFGVTLKKSTKANEEWNNAVKGAKSAEDYFNLALQECGTEAERNKLIMDTLQGTYKDATGAFYQNNKQIIQSRQSQIAYNDILADLGRIAATVKSTLLGMLGVSEDGSVKANSALAKVQETLSKIADNPELIKTITKVVGALALLKIGFLTTRLGVLSVKKDFLFAQEVFTMFTGKAKIAEVAGVGLGGKLKNAGKGILSYFGNVKGAMGGVNSSVGSIFTNSPILSKVSGFVGGINSRIITGLSGIAGKAAGGLTGAGSKAVGFLLKPFLSIGGRLGGILSNVGGVILKSPLGTVGRVLASGFTSFGTLLAPIGNLLKTIFAPLARLGTTLLGPLGGIAGKLFPIIGVVTLVITVFELVRKNLDKIREAIGNVFGDKGVEIFDKVVAVITNVGNAIKGVFSDGNIGAARDKINEVFGEKGVAAFDVFVKAFEKIKTAAGQFVNFVITYIVPVAEDVLNLIITSIIPGIVGFVKAAAPTIISIVQSVANFIGAIIPVIGKFIAGLMPVISQIIAFIKTYVLPIIGQVFSFITGTVLPLIAAGIQAILPIVTNILSTLLPFIQTAITTIWNIVQPIIQGILAAVQFAMPTILSIIQIVIGTVTGIIQGLMTVLGGIITFITGVFTGNWSQAWEGIKTIFDGIWQGISSICKGVINGIITAVNVVIRGLNKLKVPDWVPEIGGKGISIAEIPMLAKGTRRTPETFIAGEAGPELITNSPGRTVFNANQTKRILESQNAANETATAVKSATGIASVTNNSQSGPQTVNNYNSAPEVVGTAGKGAGNKNITITNSPTIIVEGDKPDNLDSKLAQNNADLLKQVENLLNKKDDYERRSKYG